MGNDYSQLQGPQTPAEFLRALKDLPQGDSSVYWLLSQSARSVRADRRCVLAAVKKNGLALDIVSDEFKADKEIVLAAVTNDRDAFSYVKTTSNMWKDKDFVVSLVKMQGSALQYAKPPLNTDKDVVVTAILNKGSALQYADSELKADREVALAAVLKEGNALEHVDKKANMWNEWDFVLAMVQVQGNAFSYVNKTADMWNDKDFVLRMVRMQGNALEFANNPLKADEEVVVAAVKERGDALAFVDKTAKVWGKKELVLSLVQSTGRALEFAADHIKADKTVVLAAVGTTPTALKFASAKKGLNQDRDCWKASGLRVNEQQTYTQNEQATLSMRSTSTDYATNFAVFLKRSSYFRNFKTNNPSGETQRNKQLHLEKSKTTNGFMIQVQDKWGLGDGQKIETQMAQQAGIKIFRTMTTSEDVDESQLVVLEEAVKDWYKKGCKNMYMIEIQLR